MLGRTLRAAASREDRRSGPRVAGSTRSVAPARRSAATTGSRRWGVSATAGWLGATASAVAAAICATAASTLCCGAICALGAPMAGKASSSAIACS